jgi:hypothetical protein
MGVSEMKEDPDELQRMPGATIYRYGRKFGTAVDADTLSKDQLVKAIRSSWHQVVYQEEFDRYAVISIDGDCYSATDIDPEYVFAGMIRLVKREVDLDDQAAVEHALVLPPDPETARRYVAKCIAAAKANKGTDWWMMSDDDRKAAVDRIDRAIAEGRAWWTSAQGNSEASGP